MKITVLFLVLVIVLATLTAVDAWRRRRIRVRVRFRRIIKPVCSKACSYVCRKPSPGCSRVVCSPVCRNICRGKRDTNKEYGDGFFLKPMPCNFSTYDVNGDKVITPAELGSLTNESGKEDDVKQMFKIMDVDGDGGVTLEEFEVAPLIKDCGGRDGAKTERKERDFDEGSDINEDLDE